MATSCTDCTSWPTPPNNFTKETGVVTYLDVACNGKGPQDETGGMYQLEAYIGALWLDVNRLGMNLTIVTECMPADIIAN
jgi:hypothetical protein